MGQEPLVTCQSQGAVIRKELLIFKLNHLHKGKPTRTSLLALSFSNELQRKQASKSLCVHRYFVISDCEFLNVDIV